MPLSRPGGKFSGWGLAMSVRSALQINLHPLDARLVSHALKHQLQTWGDQVERVSLTIDTKRSRNGRYRGTAY